jgi:hypothetical protein
VKFKTWQNPQANEREFYQFINIAKNSRPLTSKKISLDQERHSRQAKLCGEKLERNQNTHHTGHEKMLGRAA